MIPGHDRLCPVVATDLSQCPQCALIAKVRADEREHTAFLHEALLRNQLAYLRAKVEALRGKWQRSVDRDPDGKLSGYDRAHVAALGDVLALMDEGSSDA